MIVQSLLFLIVFDVCFFCFALGSLFLVLVSLETKQEEEKESWGEKQSVQIKARPRGSGGGGGTEGGRGGGDVEVSERWADGFWRRERPTAVARPARTEPEPCVGTPVMEGTYVPQELLGWSTGSQFTLRVPVCPPSGPVMR